MVALPRCISISCLDALSLSFLLSCPMTAMWPFATPFSTLWLWLAHSVFILSSSPGWVAFSWSSHPSFLRQDCHIVAPMWLIIFSVTVPPLGLCWHPFHRAVGLPQLPGPAHQLPLPHSGLLCLHHLHHSEDTLRPRSTQSLCYLCLSLHCGLYGLWNLHLCLCPPLTEEQPAPQQDPLHPLQCRHTTPESLHLQFTKWNHESCSEGHLDQRSELSEGNKIPVIALWDSSQTWVFLCTAMINSEIITRKGRSSCYLCFLIFIIIMT